MLEGPHKGSGGDLSTQNPLLAPVLEEERSLSHRLTARVSVGQAAFPTRADKCAGSDAKHAANWFICFSLISVCMIMKEPAEGMERDVTTVQGQKWLVKPGHPSALQDRSPLGFASWRTLVWSCNSLPKPCWPRTWQSQCTHPNSHSTKCLDAYGHPGCRRRGDSDAQPSPAAPFRVSRKPGEGGDHSTATTPTPTHCKGSLGARISSCISGVRRCPVISFTVCPDGAKADAAAWPG